MCGRVLCIVEMTYQNVIDLFVIVGRESCQEIQYLTLTPFSEISQSTMDRKS